MDNTDGGPPEEAPQALAITTVVVPDGNYRTPYSTPLVASGGTPPYSWHRSNGVLPGGIAVDAAGGALVGTPTTPGDFLFTIKVIDAAKATASVDLVMHVGPEAIVITPFDPLAVTVGLPVSVRFEATGGGGGSYSWAALPLSDAGAGERLPPGLRLQIDGLLTGVPAYPAGSYRFELVARKDVFRTVLPVEIVVTAQSGLRIVTAALPDMHQGEPYTATLAVSGGASPHTFSTGHGSSPTGLTLTPTGELTGTPTQNAFSAVDRDTLEVLVTDAVGASAFAALPYNYVAEPVTIPELQLPDGTVGSSYDVGLQRTGPTGNDQWSVTDGALPDGVFLHGAGMISGNSGARLSGDPTTPGVFEFELTVASHGQIASRPFSVTIRPRPVAIVTAALPTATSGIPYQVFLVAEGGTAPYTWSIESGSLPPELTLSPSGELAGMPIAPGTFDFTLRADDSSPESLRQSDTVALSLTVDP